MVRLINAFREDRPIGQVLANLGQTLFGDQAGAQLTREQALAAQRGNVETANLMRQIAQNGGVQALGADPVTQAMLIGSGYAPQDFARIGLMGAATGEGARSDAATNWTVGAGLPFSNTAQAFDQADATDRYGIDTTAETSRINNAADNAAALARQNALPLEAIGPDGLPAFTTNGATDGYQPVLTQPEVQGFNLQKLFPTLTPQQQLTAVDAAPSLDQVRAGVATDALGTETGLAGLDAQGQAFIGADPTAGGGTTPKNYRAPDGTTFITYDGITDAATGQQLPTGGQIISTSLQGGAADIGLTNAAQTDAQSDVVAANKFNAIVDMALPLTENGTLFGPVGWVRSKGQELLQSVRAAMDVVDPGTPVLNAQTGEAAGTIAQFIPEMFDPQLSEVETLWGALLYQGASALAGQQGRSVSDADVQFMRTILGNPMGLFSSAASMRAKLLQAQAVVNALSNVSRDVLQNGINTTPAAVAPPTAADVAPARTPDADGWTTLPDGTRYRQVSP